MSEMKIIFPEGKKVNALYNGFTIETDQEKESGGQGSALEPFDLFLASLGTCAGVYILNFIQNRKFSTEGLEVTLQSEYDEELHLVTKVIMNITLPKDFPTKYEKALIRSAQLCSVKRHLKSIIQFEIKTNYKNSV